MRIELAGSLVHPDPLVLKFTVDQDFVPADYIDLGYTHFEVICIGGAGGMGGGINTNNTGTKIRSYGGAGGGGGFHRVRGLLSALPATCPVVVGTGGAKGTEHASNPALTTNGEDGEASTFNDTTCRASGGKGGKRVQTNSLTDSTLADGGDGGVGNRTTAGGGAEGGTAGTPTALGPGTPGTDGEDGTFFNNIGEGGGGGAGGVGNYETSVMSNAATSGGRGSYNPGDMSVYGPEGIPTNDLDTATPSIVPGGGGGAKAAPLNGLPTMYGRARSTNNGIGDPGIVILRLTAE